MVDVVPSRSDAELRGLALGAYALFVLAMFNGITAVIGVVLAYVKRDEARGTIWESHFRNLIRVFWISLAAGVILVAVVLQAFGGLFFSMATTNGNPPPMLVGGLVILIPVLWLAVVLLAVWYLYRVLRGVIRGIEGRPY